MWLRWEGATLKFLGWLPSSITISASIFPGTAPSIVITTGQETPHLSLVSVDAQPIERTVLGCAPLAQNGASAAPFCANG